MVIKPTAPGDCQETVTPPHHSTGNTTLPVPNPTQSYWRTPPHHLDSLRSTPSLPTTCDVLIIGAGLAGVSVLYHLFDRTAGRADGSPSPPPTVLLLDARQACSGATGRNGGHVKVKIATLLALLARADDDDDDMGVGAGEELARFVSAQIAALKEVAEREEGLAAECEFELRRSYDVFLRERDAAWVEREWRRRVVLGRGHDEEGWARERDFVAAEFAERVTGIRGARAAVSGPACSLWPYRFVMGLLERVVWRGGDRVNVQMETPVVGVETDGDGWNVVRTERGVVKARKVVFATNGYTAGLVRRYEGVITPYKGTAAHLAAEGREPVYPHLSHTYNLEFGRGKLERVDYLNPRPDGGIVVGGGKWLYEEQRELWDNTVDDSTLIEPVTKAKYFEGYMQRNFRGWEDSGTEVERIWTGIQGRTPDGMPHIGKVPGEQNQWILAGFNGGGNALIFLSAKGIARMVLDDVPFEETGTGIPKMFKTTAERLAKHS